MSQTGQDLERIAGDWVAAFNRAVTQLDAAALAGLAP